MQCAFTGAFMHSCVIHRSNICFVTADVITTSINYDVTRPRMSNVAEGRSENFADYRFGNGRAKAKGYSLIK